MTLILSDCIPIIEPVPIRDEFASRLARIEDLDGAARFVLVQRQTCYEAGDKPMWVVCNKIILPWEAIGPGVEMTTAYLARRAISIAGARLLRLVR